MAVPEPVTLAGLMATHVRPLGTVSVSNATPANPLSAVTEMVEEVEPLIRTVAGGDALIEKSCTVKVAVAV